MKKGKKEPLRQFLIQRIILLFLKKQTILKMLTTNLKLKNIPKIINQVKKGKYMSFHNFKLTLI